MTVNSITAGRKQCHAGTNSLTGRDGYIVAQALYWFIRTQQALPKDQYEWSNSEDAKLILLNLYPSVAGMFVRQDQNAGRVPADLTLVKYDDVDVRSIA